jgi:hypothetical protein
VDDFGSWGLLDGLWRSWEGSMFEDLQDQRWFQLLTETCIHRR